MQRRLACLSALGFPLLRIAAVALALSPVLASADPPIREDLRALDEHIQLHPEDVGALIARSELRRRSGEPTEALLDLRVAEALAPGDTRIAVQRAEVLHAIGRDEDALAELDATLPRIASPSLDALALRARVLVAVERLTDAVEAYDSALTIGDDVDLYLERGRLLERLGRLDDAARGYAEGVGALDGAVALRLAGIELDLRIGRPGHALGSIDAAMANAPARARWLLLRGRALDALGRREEARSARESALAELDRRLARRPTAALHVDRGEALLAMGRSREALDEAQRAQSSAPRLASAAELEQRARRVIGGAR